MEKTVSQEESLEEEPIDLADARERIGAIWGLDRAITSAELARALRLSPKFGSRHIANMQQGKTVMTGPIRGLIEAMLDGYKVRHMVDVIKPGYPRGPVR